MFDYVGGANAIKLFLEILVRIFEIHRDKAKTRKRSFNRFLHRRLVYNGNMRSYGMNKLLDFFGITASHIEVRRIFRYSQDLACFLIHVVLINPRSGYRDAPMSRSESILVPNIASEASHK